MRFCFTSDFHGYLPEIPVCDLLLIGGDITPVWDHHIEVQRYWLRHDFTHWLNNVPAKEIVGIAGNHDFAAKDKYFMNGLPWRYLEDEMTTVYGLKIWGSPLSPLFGKWDFMMRESELFKQWRKIPRDIDILLVHGPAYGINDETMYAFPNEDPHVGCRSLRNQLECENWPNLKYVISGHIHEAYGQQEFKTWTEMNVSYVDGEYRPGNPPVIVEV